MQVVKMVS